MEEDDVESLLESIGEELTTDDLEDLEQQRRRLEEEAEAGQQPETPQRKEMTILLLQEFLASINHSLNLLEEMDPDCERSGLKRVMTNFIRGRGRSSVLTSPSTSLALTLRRGSRGRG